LRKAAEAAKRAKAEAEAAEAAERAQAERRRREGAKLVLRPSTLETQRILFEEVLARSFGHAKTGFVPRALVELKGALAALEPRRIEAAVRKIMAGLRRAPHQSERDWFHSAFYLVLRALGRNLDKGDPVHDGVVDVVVDEPGRAVVLLQFRNADHSWTPGAMELPARGEEDWPWRPAPPQELEPWREPLIESEDGHLIELDRILGLEAMLAIKVMEDWGYPADWLPLGRRVFLVGVGVFGRQRVRAVVQEALPEADGD
jgi:hypothetical protein